MKAAIRLLTLALLFVTASAMAHPVDQPASIRSFSAAPQTVFAFKVSKKFRKGLVEVYSAQGELVATTALSKRKMVINFADVTSGTYIIKVKRFNCVEEFLFEKR